MDFGERLYKLRIENNLSQEQLAQLLDVSRQSISKWENGKGYPEMNRLLFMSNYFKVSLDYLVRGSEEITNDHKEYSPKGLVYLWNSFLTNLSKKQIRIMYVLLVVLIIVIIICCVYDMGYAFGKAIYYLQQ